MADRDLVNLLSAVNENLQRISARSPRYIDAASPATGRSFKTLVIQEDTVLTTVTGVNGTNFVTLWGISAKTLKQGAILSAPNNEPIAAVTPSPGSLIGYE